MNAGGMNTAACRDASPRNVWRAAPATAPTSASFTCASMRTRAPRNARDAPMSIYEMHIGTFSATAG